MKRSISGTFQTATPTLAANVGDLASSNISYFAAHTPGNCITIQPTLGGPTQNEKWTLLSVSVQAGLVFITGESAFNASPSEDSPSAGRLGNIQAFLLPGESNQSVSATGQPNTVGFRSPITSNPLLNMGAPAPPFDETLASDLWNYQNDAMPPMQQIADGKALLPISASIVPPFPLAMLPGNPPLIGINMLPSLIEWGNLPNPAFYHLKGLAVFGASFIVNYDDGT